jgi:hypothetical protein
MAVRDSEVRLVAQIRRRLDYDWWIVDRSLVATLIMLGMCGLRIQFI